MTDRFHSLTVALDKDMRDDDAQSLIAAILHFKGVISVGGNVTDSGMWMAEQRALDVLRKQMLDILFPKIKGT